MEFLTKLEELVLIAVLRLKDEAYGITIFNQICKLTGKDITVSSVYFPLERLVKKGYLYTLKGEPTPKRGGMRKRYYRLTRPGILALQENRAINETAWKGIPKLLKYLE